MGNKTGHARLHPQSLGAALSPKVRTEFENVSRFSDAIIVPPVRDDVELAGGSAPHAALHAALRRPRASQQQRGAEVHQVVGQDRP
jgi:hypothetical protein